MMGEAAFMVSQADNGLRERLDQEIDAFNAAASVAMAQTGGSGRQWGHAESDCEPAAPDDSALERRQVSARRDGIVLVASVALERAQVDESGPVGVQVATSWDMGEVDPQVGTVGGAQSLQPQDQVPAGTVQHDGRAGRRVLKTAETARAQDLQPRRRRAVSRGAAAGFPGGGRLDDPRYRLVDGLVEEQFLRLEPHQDKCDQPHADKGGGASDERVPAG